MNIIELVVFLGVAVGAVVLYVQFNKGQKKTDENVLKMLNDTFNERMRDMTKQFQEQTNQMNLRLRENNDLLQKSNKHIGERLDNAAHVVSGVTEKLGVLQEATKRMTEVGKDISSLHDILRAPKLRGSLGEFFLHDILSQYFTKDQFSMPYKFRNGEMVDAALHLADDIIVPIDSKFPLENFKKLLEAKDEKDRKAHHKVFIADVKKRIDEIARYILPDEKTTDFALMYIPAENVYYEVIIKDADEGAGENNLCSYAFKKRVIPVSPNNFFVYIQTILMGLRGLKIEKGAREMLATLVRLKGDFAKFGEDYEVLGSHIANAGNKYDESHRRLEKLGQKFDAIEASEEKKLLK